MRTKFSGILTLLLAFVVQLTFAQEKTISGTVTDQSGLPLPGVNIVIKGTSTGTQTDFDGNYSVKANKGAVLAYSYLGFQTQEIAVGDNNTINVQLSEDAAQLEEVVVTAQGIRREKKALGYAVATIASDEIASKPQTDVVRALTGKAPGVNITQTSGLSGSGTNIIIRGYSSINGSNQPLFVVDGVPFNSDTNADRNFVQGGASASSRFLDIDPNNIKEISVLKGLSATTLYGQAGRNGVVLITTKTGSQSDANKKFEINLNHSYFANKIANLPDYQDTYGNGFYQNYSQAFSNWGPSFDTRGQQGIAADGTVPHPYDRANLASVFPEFQGARYEYRPYDSVEEFFDTGNVINTSVSASASGENSNISFSFGQTDDEGFVPNNSYERLNLSIGGSAKLSNKFTISSSMNYVRTDRIAPPTASSFGSNPNDGSASLFANILYTPRSVDLFGLPFENPLDNSTVYYRGGNDIDNPRWTSKNITDLEKVRRFFGNITTVYQLNDWMNLSYRLSLDGYNQQNEFRANKGGNQIANGILQTSNRESTVFDHTLSLNFDKDITDRINLNGTLGLNPRNEKLEGNFINSSQQNIYGLLTHQNFEESNGQTFFNEFNILGAYASLTFGYDNFLYVNVQGRNDWFSSLSRENRSIFYPSASISFVPTSAFEGLKGSKSINYLKLRLGYGSSAGFPDAYSTIIGLTSNTNIFVRPTGEVLNTLSIPNTLGNPNLKPELISELEAGLEARLFDNRIGFDFSIYSKTSKDLILQDKPLDPSTGYTLTADNLGEVTNEGIEVGFNATIIRAKQPEGFQWDISGQYTINENIVVDNGSGEGSIVPFAGFGTLGNAAISGEAYGVIVGSSILRDANGNFVVGADGNYLANPELSIIGDPNADWRSTLINELSFKNFTLSAQLEYTHGGDIYSTTASALLSRGLTTDTDFDRSQTYILPGVTTEGAPNTTQIAATDYGFNNSGFVIDEQAVYDATTIRLREISLSYDFPKRFLDQTPFGKVTFRIIGQNMWYKAVNFPKGLNFDPEVISLGVGNGQGFDYLTGPTAKRYGFSLNLTF